jgi:hypothetical protein
MNFVVLFLVAAAILALCLLGMAVRVIVQKRRFSKACACEFDADKARCGSCTDRTSNIEH